MSEEVTVPPGQIITERFPVLTYGNVPVIDLSWWRLRLFGLVEQEVVLSWYELMGLPSTTVEADFHCVTGWSRLGNRWGGVSFEEVTKVAKVKTEAKYVTFSCFGGYTTSLALEVLMADEVLLAHQHDGKPLDMERGWPVRLVVPKRYGWKSAKWVKSIEYVAEDQGGFWEKRGYSSNADPWKEERFR